MLLDGLIQRWQAFPWRCTAIATPSSSTTPASRRRRGKPPSSPVSLQELGIRQIFARSPQAKGRVERMAETFQANRLCHRTAPGGRQDH